MSPSLLAKITRIQRPTVYSTAKELIAKGIIAEEGGTKTLHFTPLPAEHLMQLVEKPRRELDAKEAFVQKAMAEISLMTADKKYSVPKIQFIEEEKVEDFLYTNFAKWFQEIRTTDSVWWGFQDQSFTDRYEKWILWTWQTEAFKRHDVKVKFITNTSPIEEKIKKKVAKTRRDMHYIPDINFSSTVWVAGDYLVMVVSQQQPAYLVEIHDAALAHNMREVLKKLWGLSGEKEIA